MSRGGPYAAVICVLLNQALTDLDHYFVHGARILARIFLS